MVRVLFSMRRQVGLLGAIGIGGVLAISGIAILSARSLDDRQRRADHMSAEALLVSRIGADLLDARRAEKDFLLRSDEQYVARPDAVSGRVNANLDRLSGMTGESAQAELLRPKLETIKAGFSVYRQAFAGLASKSRELGLDEKSGLQGALRASVHAVESKLSEYNESRLTNLMLMMRRHEKDFMLRLDPKYGADIKKRSAEFDKALAASSFPPQIRDETAARMAAYQRDVAAYIEGRLSVVDATRAMSKAYADFDPIVDEVGAAIRKAHEADQELITARRAHAERLVIALSGFVLLIAGAISFAIGRGIARPITGMTAVMAQLARGDTSVAIPGLSRGDEIGQWQGLSRFSS
jgi:methyl-accepting chemotaxis protein